jgi:hypothetical protein
MSARAQHHNQRFDRLVHLAANMHGIAAGFHVFAQPVEFPGSQTAVFDPPLPIRSRQRLVLC